MDFFTPPKFKMNTSALMFDLETGGVEPGAVVLSIGAIIFDPYQPIQGTAELKKISFYRNIDPQSCEALGLTYNPDTLAWWEEQSVEAKAALAEDQRPLKEVAREFLLWLSNHPYEISSVWANSPSFDRVIWEHALRSAGKRWPLPFWAERCLRTLKALAWPNNNAPSFRGDGVHHNALDDAVTQAKLVQAGHERLKPLAL